MERHVQRIKMRPEFFTSEVVIMVERNLGFEAEHHQRALNGLQHTRFRIDYTANRYGISIDRPFIVLTETKFSFDNRGCQVRHDDAF